LPYFARISFRSLAEFESGWKRLRHDCLQMRKFRFEEKNEF
jgi:hypothetical protein